MAQDNTITIEVIGGIKEDFEGCHDCKHIKLPAEACKVMGCIHAWKTMRDMYEKENHFREVKE